MNKEQAKGNWDQFAGKLREKWGKLTDNDMERAKGSAQALSGRVQELYGIGKEEFEREYNTIKSSCNYCGDKDAA